MSKEQQNYLIKSKLFRKAELIDLIATVKQMDSDSPSYNEMMVKREKMQAELDVIEETLFDIMKKSGNDVERLI